MRGRDTEVVVDTERGAPVLLHWGPLLAADLDLEALSRASERPVNGSADTIAPVSVVPEHGAAFTGRPGLAGHRPGGTAWAPQFVTTHVEGDDQTLRVVARDEVAEL